MAEIHRTQTKLECHLEKNRKQLEKLRGEIAKVLIGDSIYTEEDLAEALNTIKARITEDEKRLAQLKDEDVQKKAWSNSVVPAYKQFKSWVEELEEAPHL